MSDYTYTGVDKAGKRVTGTISAPTEGELRMVLRGQGIRPTKIQRAAEKKGGPSGGSNVRVPFDILLIFTRQLYVLMSSGIPLIQALETLADQSSNKAMQGVLTNMKDKVSQGSYFWETLSLYPGIFSKLYVSLIRAGEASGAMDEMLSRLTSYMEDADRLRKLLKSAAIYPVAVVTVGIGVISLMLIFVIPKFEDMLKNAGQELPGPTKFVINCSHFLIGHIIPILVGGSAAIFMTLRFFRTQEGRAFRDRLFYNLPLFGPLMQKGAVARFSRTLQTLLGSGVALLDAIDICKQTIDNAVVEESVGKIRSEVESGNRLGAVINKYSVFPKMAVQMISIGEASGSLDQMLEKVADFYEAEVESMVGGLTKLIEPFILVFLGGTVGGMLIAMYLPIFKLAGGAD